MGLSQTLNSGNQFQDRSDARGAIRLSCKSSTVALSWSQVKRWLREAIDMAAGSGESPALAILDHDGAKYFLMKLDHAGDLLSDEARRAERKPSRAEVVKDQARTPVLLREDEDN